MFIPLCSMREGFPGAACLLLFAVIFLLCPAKINKMMYIVLSSLKRVEGG